MCSGKQLFWKFYKRLELGKLLKIYVKSMKSSYERAHYYEVVGKEPVTLSFSQMLRFCHEFQASHYSEHL